jgi:hypothetical protein
MARLTQDMTALLAPFAATPIRRLAEPLAKTASTTQTLVSVKRFILATVRDQEIPRFARDD